MSGPDDIVREALASLLAEHPLPTATDPGAVRGLLETRLGSAHQVAPELLDAVVLATHTPVLRNLPDDAHHDATEAQLDSALRKLGVGGSAAATAASCWADALVRAGRAGAPAPLVPSSRAVVANEPPRAAGAPGLASPPPLAPPPPPTPPRFAPPESSPPEPAPTAPTPPVSAPPPAPPLPDPRPARPRPAWLEAPALAHDISDPVRDDADPPADIPGPPTGPARVETERADRPRAARRLAAVLALLAVALGVLAIAGWTRDPSKTRASSAESEVTQLSNDLASAKQATVDANAATTAAKATIAERDAQLAAAKDQIAKMSAVTRAQLNGARFPDSFAMSGKVAAGSCSLTGEACNVTAIVRSIKLTCATKPCDCTTGSCSVTSELWRAAAPVTFDASTNLFSAKGLLDGDVFRCAGVAQPTNFEFRFRVAKVSFDEGVWKVSGIDAELAESSSAVAECLAGNRTYALTGPTA